MSNLFAFFMTVTSQKKTLYCINLFLNKQWLFSHLLLKKNCVSLIRKFWEEWIQTALHVIAHLTKKWLRSLSPLCVFFQGLFYKNHKKLESIIFNTRQRKCSHLMICLFLTKLMLVGLVQYSVHGLEGEGLSPSPLSTSIHLYQHVSKSSFLLLETFGWNFSIRVLPRSSSQIYIDFLPASFNYASLVALIELCRKWYLVLIRVMR
jgi:hypothetical protein